MMHYASQGVRNAARKGSNALIHHGGHNGPGGSTSTNTTRSFHIHSNFLGTSRVAHPPLPHINSLEAIRPRNPGHKLFSVSKNVLQTIFTHLTAPGLRAPTYLAQARHAGARSLQTASAHATSIEGRLSAAARASLRARSLQNTGNLFLPRAPTVPPRFGGIAQVGLGAARNFSSARPIYQNLAENVPIAIRALQEVDLDVKGKENAKRRRIRKQAAKVSKSKEMLKPSQKANHPVAEVEEKAAATNQEIDHFFPESQVATVCTTLFIPLAPTATSRLPLDLERDPPEGARLLPPLSYLGVMHRDYQTHFLRVQTVFLRLEQAGVFNRDDVKQSFLTQGIEHQTLGKGDNGETHVEGTCTIVKLTFTGWTEARVRGILGESGSGWCVLEEVGSEESSASGRSTPSGSGLDSLSSEIIMEDWSDETRTHEVPEVFGLGEGPYDPAQSFVLPTLELSDGSDSPPSTVLAVVPVGLETDPWNDGDYDNLSDGSEESSLSDYSDLMIEPPSTNGYFSRNHQFIMGFSAMSGRSEEGPRESMFL